MSELEAIDPPELIAPEPPEVAPFCDRCMSYGHDNHDCIDDYLCPGTGAEGSFDPLGVLRCPHCDAQFIGTSVPRHEEEL